MEVVADAKKFALRAITVVQAGGDFCLLYPTLNQLHGLDFLSDRLASTVWVWAVAGLGGLSNGASRNAKANQVVTVHRGQTL